MRNCSMSANLWFKVLQQWLPALHGDTTAVKRVRLLQDAEAVTSMPVYLDDLGRHCIKVAQA